MIRLLMPFYAVQVGRNPGIYTSWDHARSQVDRFSGAIFKKFENREDAEKFLKPRTTVATYSASEDSNQVTSLTSQSSASSFSEQLYKNSFVIYTDGSCLGNQNVRNNNCPAGWSAVIAKGEHQSDIIHELFGVVVIDHDSPYFLGADIGSNNTGELTAIGEALLWLLVVDSTDASAIIRYDSEYAANSILGKYGRATKNLELIRNIQKIYQQVSTKREITLEKVKAHSSDVLNNRADYLAKYGAVGNICAVGRYAPGWAFRSDYTFQLHDKTRATPRQEKRAATSSPQAVLSPKLSSWESKTMRDSHAPPPPINPLVVHTGLATVNTVPASSEETGSFKRVSASSYTSPGNKRKIVDLTGTDSPPRATNPSSPDVKRQGRPR